MNANLSPSTGDFTFTAPDGRQFVVGVETSESNILATSYAIIPSVYLMLRNSSLPAAWEPLDATALMETHIAQTQVDLDKLYNGAPYPGFSFRNQLSYDAGTKTVSLLP